MSAVAEASYGHIGYELDQDGHPAAVAACPIRTAAWDEPAAPPTPRLGEATGQVLTPWLGMQDADIGSLVARKAIAVADTRS